MEIEQFKKVMQEVKETIAEAGEKKQKAIKLYIEENKPFNIGDRIVNKSSGQFGYVTGFEIGYLDEIRPIAVKEKKNGEKSLHGLYIWKSNDVELAK